MSAPPFPPVAELVPQRPPMLLLDHVVAACGDTIACAAVVRPDNLFARDGRVHATTVLEYMAQTIAALAGLHARELGQPPALGFIAACRGLELHLEHLDPGDSLRIEAERVWPPRAAPAALVEYRARVRRDGALVAEADIHVVADSGDSPRRSP